jgi:hypothetical protein
VKQRPAEGRWLGDLQPAVKVEAGKVALVGIAWFGDLMELVVLDQDGSRPG